MKSLAIFVCFFNPSNSLALNPTTKAAHIACEKLMKSLSCMVFTEIYPHPQNIKIKVLRNHPFTNQSKTQAATCFLYQQRGEVDRRRTRRIKKTGGMDIRGEAEKINKAQS